MPVCYIDNSEQGKEHQEGKMSYYPTEVDSGFYFVF